MEDKMVQKNETCKLKLKTDLNQSCFYDPVINALTREEKTT